MPRGRPPKNKNLPKVKKEKTEPKEDGLKFQCSVCEFVSSKNVETEKHILQMHYGVVSVLVEDGS